MNMTAAVKTLLVVLGAGAFAGYFDWQEVNGRTPAERTARQLASCIEAGKAAEYRKSPLMMGRALDASNKQVEANCRNELQANTRPTYLQDSATAPTPAPPAKSAGPQQRQRQHQVEAKPAQAQAASVTMTSKLDQCLERIEEARKRSPGGLNPEWEQGERDRCKAL